MGLHRTGAAHGARDTAEFHGHHGLSEATAGATSTWVWDEGPSNRHLTAYYVFLTLSAFVTIAVVKNLRPGSLRQGLRAAGVAVRRVKLTIYEIERKTFHLAGLLVPLVYQVLLNMRMSHSFCVRLCWVLTGAGWALDLGRLWVPWVRDNFPLKVLLREREAHALCGACYFSLGCTLSISLFPPSVACASIIFLVLGDMSAALIGVSFGGDVCVVKLGREGNKSLEGSVAMFCVCIAVGCGIFSQVPLREYAVFIGALGATLTELHEPLGVNDNLTVPVVSGLLLTWGFLRLSSSCAQMAAAAEDGLTIPGHQ
mmetsp:Transcript_24242/g.65696  ORF Transcript_24242/g.65696 Transcript_24242/m.65696 type:complete len:313 (+) Transcript_24242:159-1097(+)